LASPSVFTSLFLNSILGYTRVILAAVSMHYMPYHPNYCTLAYCVSCLLDAVDGPVARARGETSKFGAVLDMVTDRFLSFSLPYVEGSCPSSDVPLPASCVTSRQHIHGWPGYSSSSSPWISAVTICICTGPYPCLSASGTTQVPFSSLVTGSSSHKRVRSDVSRIMSLYYDSVRIPFLFTAPT
jgi:CDP-diacylglycerol--inositol 3-phosphatidyltransferase